MNRARILVRLLARTANWRCSDCDTWNSDSDTKCMTCS